MNIISTIVGLSIMGAATPMLMEMSLAPAIAQKKAQNFGHAESAAVLYVAQNQLATSRGNLTPDPDKCTSGGTGSAVNISCTFGTGKYAQNVIRAFVLRPPSTSNSGNGNNTGNGARSFVYATPKIGAHPCIEDSDPWGVNWWNDLNASSIDACIPSVAKDQPTYLASNPDDWLYEINNINGWGHHPHY